jgi:hypothetical protein
MSPIMSQISIAEKLSSMKNLLGNPLLPWLPWYITFKSFFLAHDQLPDPAESALILHKLKDPVLKESSKCIYGNQSDHPHENYTK